MIVRCKLYVTSVNRSLFQGSVEEQIEANFSTVYSPNPETENYTFWNASPSGNLKIILEAEEVEVFKPGTFWYVDTRPIEEFDEKPDSKNIWRLAKISNEYAGNLQVEFMKISGRGTERFTVTIANKNVWDQYTQVGKEFHLNFLAATKD